MAGRDPAIEQGIGQPLVDRFRRLFNAFTPIFRCAGNDQGARGVEQNRIAIGALFALQQAAQCSGIVCRIAAANGIDRGDGKARILRGNPAHGDFTIAHFRQFATPARLSSSSPSSPETTSE